MANKRDYKKSVRYIAQTLLAQCLLRCNNKEIDTTQLATCIQQIAALQHNYLIRANALEKLHARQHFQQLRTDCAKDASAILEGIYAL